MSQISNWMKMQNSKYNYLLKVKTYEEEINWLLVKRDNFPNFEIFEKVLFLFLFLWTWLERIIGTTEFT